MGFKTKKIQNLYVSTPDGDLVLSAKSGEDPEFKPFIDSIEDTDDGLTNDGQLILNVMPERSYIQGVFGYSDEDVPLLKSLIEFVKSTPTDGVPANVIFTDGSIYSNVGVFSGGLIYNGTGTIELKFVSAKDFIIQ